MIYLDNGTYVVNNITELSEVPLKVGTVVLIAGRVNELYYVKASHGNILYELNGTCLNYPTTVGNRLIAQETHLSLLRLPESNYVFGTEVLSRLMDQDMTRIYTQVFKHHESFIRLSRVGNIYEYLLVAHAADNVSYGIHVRLLLNPHRYIWDTLISFYYMDGEINTMPVVTHGDLFMKAMLSKYPNLEKNWKNVRDVVDPHTLLLKHGGNWKKARAEVNYLTGGDDRLKDILTPIYRDNSITGWCFKDRYDIDAYLIMSGTKDITGDTSAEVTIIKRRVKSLQLFKRNVFKVNPRSGVCYNHPRIYEDTDAIVYDDYTVAIKRQDWFLVPEDDERDEVIHRCKMFKLLSS